MSNDDARRSADRVIRHHLIDRLFHWANAIVVLVLLGTSLLPIVGIKFPWVTAHWIAGVVLIVLVAFHGVRSLIWQDFWSMSIGRQDIARAVQSAAWMLRRTARPPDAPGKYPLLQKLFHHVMALAILVLIVTGGLVLAKIDTPFWTRDPYILSAQTWGIVYVLHDLAALVVLGMVMVHIYFAIRPEKLWITRSMILGWITRREYEAHHDPALWREQGDGGRPPAATGASPRGETAGPPRS
jgi:cytochrome b subunit of formate dehydrogenase